MSPISLKAQSNNTHETKALFFLKIKLFDFIMSNRKLIRSREPFDIVIDLDEEREWGKKLDGRV